MICLEFYYYFQNMVEENIGEECRLKNIVAIRNYEIIEKNELMNRIHKNIWITLN